MKRKNNHYTLWYSYSCANSLADGIIAIDRSSSYPHIFYIYNGAGSVNIPIVSTHFGWRKNKEYLEKYFKTTGSILSFLMTKSFWVILKRCFREHLKPIMKELISSYTLNTSIVRILNWDTSKYPDPTTLRATPIYADTTFKIPDYDGCLDCTLEDEKEGFIVATSRYCDTDIKYNYETNKFYAERCLGYGLGMRVECEYDCISVYVGKTEAWLQHGSDIKMKFSDFTVYSINEVDLLIECIERSDSFRLSDEQKKVIRNVGITWDKYCMGLL